MTWQSIVAVSAIVAVGAILQGTVGFGLGLFAVPLLLLVAPGFVPGPLLAASLVLTLLLALRHRQAINWRDLGWALGGRVVGIGLAVALLATASGHTLALWSGLFVLTAVAITGSGLNVAPAPRTLVVAGVFSGILSTVVSMGGPPIALLYQREQGPRLRGTLSAFFLLGVMLSLLGLHIAGHFGMSAVHRALVLVPGILAGYGVARPLAPVIDRGYTRPAVLIVSAAAGLLVVLRALR